MTSYATFLTAGLAAFLTIANQGYVRPLARSEAAAVRGGCYGPSVSNCGTTTASCQSYVCTYTGSYVCTAQGFAQYVYNGNYNDVAPSGSGGSSFNTSTYYCAVFIPCITGTGCQPPPGGGGTGTPVCQSGPWQPNQLPTTSRTPTGSCGAS